jgi:hypothetical protein
MLVLQQAALCVGHMNHAYLDNLPNPTQLNPTHGLIQPISMSGKFDFDEISMNSLSFSV